MVGPSAGSPSDWRRRNPFVSECSLIYARRLSPRARPMSPDERRAELIDVTLRLMRVHGRDVTTRQIAEAAGVAEGTIFRVFASKDELVDAALERAFEPGDLVVRIEEIDRGLPLRARLVVLVSILQQRHPRDGRADAQGRPGPAARCTCTTHAAAVEWRKQLLELLADLVGGDADQLAVPVDHFLHVLRLLTFAGSHELVADGRLLTPNRSSTPSWTDSGEETDAAPPAARAARAVPILARPRGAVPVHRRGRDALPAEPERRHHRQGRGHRRHRLHHPHRRPDAGDLARPDRLLGHRRLVRRPHRDGPRPRPARPRSSTGSARSRPARCSTSAHPR